MQLFDTQYKNWENSSKISAKKLHCKKNPGAKLLLLKKIIP
jgi:hypothetical protein